MAMTLYFANTESRTCWPVPNCISDPAPFDVGRMSGPFRNNFQTVIESSTPAAQSLIVGHSGKVVFPGLVRELRTTAENVSPTPEYVTMANGVAVTPESGPDGPYYVFNDEAAGEDLRQSELEHTHWKVEVEAGPGEPGYCLISMDQYPDGYSNCPPSWWVDAGGGA